MVCKYCTSNIWKQKLGRCRRCMWLNLILFVSSGLASYFMLLQPRSVATIALLFALFLSGSLMLLHVIAFIYYHFSKADKRNPE